MFLAALKGNWKAAKKLLEDDPAVATARITRNSMTALHVAAGEGRHEFVERMVEMDSLISGDDLELQDGAGYTALHHAAIAGSVRASAALVKKNRGLTNILDHKGQTPLLVASRFVYGNYDVLWYLTMVTDDEPGSPFTGTPAMDLVLMLVLSGSLGMISNYGSLINTKMKQFITSFTNQRTIIADHTTIADHTQRVHGFLFSCTNGAPRVFSSLSLNLD